MTLETFKALAQSANLDVRFAEAKPYGGWDTLRDIGHAYDWAIYAHADGEVETEEEALDLVLETVIVVAVSKDGARDVVRGAWSHAGFIIGNRTLTLDEANERVTAG